MIRPPAPRKTGQTHRSAPTKIKKLLYRAGRPDGVGAGACRCDLAQAGAVVGDRVDIVRAPLLPRKDYVEAVRRPMGVFVETGGGQNLARAAGGGDDADVEIPLLVGGRTPHVSDERIGGIGRPVRRGVVAPLVGQPGDVQAVGIRHVNLRRAGTVGREGDVFAVRRKSGRRVNPVIVSEAGNHFACGID